MPCETQEPPDLHAPGGPISAFPVLDQTPGMRTNAAAPAVSEGQFDKAVSEFAEAWPEIEKARKEWRRREAEAAAKQERGR